LQTLFLLRHAKSSWDDSSLHDFDRPLSPRGIKACKMMTKHLIKSKIKPELVLCSSSRRTRETLELISGAFDDETEIRFEYGIYEAGSQALLKRLKRVNRKVSSVMMIGHNTGLEHLALALTSGTETKSLARMREKYPTLALSSIEIKQGGWAELGPGSAKLKDFVIPSDLVK
jgi:phosphohistidine phosphatase